ncbi:hypothetical protein CASFOL_023862 [Castilleja foliolosa]|uniref:Uncharacterized protein n=1 Tax=Castilleja foliolosa TaxID=1961234 RepID=A0ABD3CLQ0_9LAMI
MADMRNDNENLEPNDYVEWDGSESNKRQRLETSTENEENENITDAENTVVVDQAIENDNNDGHALVEAGIDEGNMLLIEEEEADEEEYSDDYSDYSDDDDSDYYSTDDSSYDSSNCSFFSDEPCCADSDSTELSDDSDLESIHFY